MKTGIGLEKFLEKLTQIRETNGVKKVTTTTFDSMPENADNGTAAASTINTIIDAQNHHGTHANKNNNENARTTFTLDRMLHLQCENNEADQTHKHHGNGIVEVPTEATQQCRQQQELQQNQLNILATFLRANPLVNFASIDFNNSSSNNNAQMASARVAAISPLTTNSPPYAPPSSSSVSSAVNNIDLPPPHLSTTNDHRMVVSLNQDVASRGLLAVGGCRQCAKTFTDRLSLIHHFVDHFPTIFYSFEDRQMHIQQQQQQQQSDVAARSQRNSPNVNVPMTTGMAAKEVVGTLNQNQVQQQQQQHLALQPTVDLLGQLTSLFAPFAACNGSSTSSTTNTNPFMSALGTTTTTAMSSKEKQQQLIPNTTNGCIAGDVAAFPSFAGTFASNFMGTIGNLNGTDGNVYQGKQRPPISINDNGIAATNQLLVNNKTTTPMRKRKQNERNVQQQQQQQILAKKANIGGGGGGGNNAKGVLTSFSELPYHMCPHCCLTFAETSAFKAHLATHEPDLIPDNNAAPSFSAGCTTANGKQQPQQQQQHEQLPFKCALCQFCFSNAFRLNEHMRLHSAQRCELCQKTFMTAFDLNLHMGTHTGYTYDCKDCGKCFPCRKTLAEHNRSHRMLLSGKTTTSNNNNTPEQQQMIDQKQIVDVDGILQQQLPATADEDMSSCSSHSQETHQRMKEQQHWQQKQNGGGNDRRRMRAARKGEKSRRNATLVAVERTPPPPSNNMDSGENVQRNTTTTTTTTNGNGIGSLMDRLLAHVELQQQNIA